MADKPKPTSNHDKSKLLNITKQDPEQLYSILEHIGTGSYGEVYKVYRLIGQAKRYRFNRRGKDYKVGAGRRIRRSIE